MHEVHKFLYRICRKQNYLSWSLMVVTGIKYVLVVISFSFLAEVEIIYSILIQHHLNVTSSRQGLKFQANIY